MSGLSGPSESQQQQAAPEEVPEEVQLLTVSEGSARDVDIDGLWKRIGDVDVVYEATGASQLSFAVRIRPW